MTQPLERVFDHKEGRHRRFPLLPHLVTLWLLLVAVALFVDVDRAVFDADEGALLMQVQVLLEQGEWSIPYPHADLDPDGANLGLRGALVDRGEVTPFPLRLFLVWTTAALWDIGGVFLVTLLGITSTVLAAWCIAKLTEEIEPRATIWAFWLAGAASPLTFNALVLRGHGLAVGATGLGVLLAVKAVRHSAWNLSVLLGIGGGTALLAASLIRRETVLLGAALWISGLLLSRRRNALRPIVVSSLVAAGAFIGWIIDELSSNFVLGAGRRTIPLESSSDGFVQGRVDSLLRLIEPGFEGTSPLAMLTILIAAVLACVGALSFVRRGDAQELVLGLGVAGGLLVGHLLLAEPHTVAGLLVAFPIGTVGIILLSKVAPKSDTLWWLTATFGLFVLAVLVTQYPKAGGYEWGSRYLAVGLVAIIPGVTVGLFNTWRVIEPRNRAGQFLAVALVLSLVPSLMGIAEQQRSRRVNGDNIAAGYERADQTGSRWVVSTDAEITRKHTDRFVHPIGWLYVHPSGLASLLEKLEKAGANSVPLFTLDFDDVSDALNNTDWVLEDVEIRRDNPGTVLLGTLRYKP